MINVFGKYDFSHDLKLFEVIRSFSHCVAPGGVIANVGVHGKSVDLHLESLWSKNITITTRLVDTISTPMLMKTVQSGRLNSNS